MTKISRRSSCRVKRDGTVYVRGEIVGAITKIHTGTRANDFHWKFKPNARNSKIGTIELGTRADLMDTLMKRCRSIGRPDHG